MTVKRSAGSADDRMALSPRFRTEIATRIAAAFWLAAATIYIITEAAAAATFLPDYSYAHNYISDLGVPDCGAIFDGRAICSPLHGLVNAGFVVQGVLFLGGASAIARLIKGPTKYPLVGLAAMNCIGIGLIGIFPESAAFQATAGLHVLGAFLAIVAGNATALTAGFAFRGLGFPSFHRYACIALPAMAAASLIMLLAARHAGVPLVFPDGIWERLSVYTITTWELLSAACIFYRGREGFAMSS